MKTKYKIVNKKGRKFLIINSEKDQTLNKREVEEIQNGVMQGVLPLEIEIKRTGFVLSYDLTNYIPLEQYIHTIVNKKKFVEIMLQILETFQQLTEQFYNTQNLVMDLDKVVVSPATNKIYFPFIPILYYNCGVTVKDFLIKLIYSTTFDNTEDIGYVEKCLSILQKNMNFSRVELEEYLKSQLDDGSVHSKKSTTNGIQEIYNPYEKWNWSGRDEQEKYASGGSSRMTESLSDIGAGGTVLLGTTEASYLKQVRTNQKFYLKSDESSVGKRQCTIQISDNPAVSREHARLIRVRDEMYLISLQTTNGTKVNGKRIQPEERVRLKDEDVLEFANEKFIFYQ